MGDEVLRNNVPREMTKSTSIEFSERTAATALDLSYSESNNNSTHLVADFAAGSFSFADDSHAITGESGQLIKIQQQGHGDSGSSLQLQSFQRRRPSNLVDDLAEHHPSVRELTEATPNATMTLRRPSRRGTIEFGVVSSQNNSEVSKEMNYFLGAMEKKQRLYHINNGIEYQNINISEAEHDNNEQLGNIRSALVTSLVTKQPEHIFQNCSRVEDDDASNQTKLVDPTASLSIKMEPEDDGGFSVSSMPSLASYSKAGSTVHWDNHNVIHENENTSQTFHSCAKRSQSFKSPVGSVEVVHRRVRRCHSMSSVTLSNITLSSITLSSAYDDDQFASMPQLTPCSLDDMSISGRGKSLVADSRGHDTRPVKGQRRGSLYSVGASTIASHDCAPFMVNLTHQSDCLRELNELNGLHSSSIQDPGPVKPSRRNSLVADAKVVHGIQHGTETRRPRRGSLYSLGASTIASHDCAPLMVGLSHQSDCIESMERDATVLNIVDPRPVQPSRRHSINSDPMRKLQSNEEENNMLYVQDVKVDHQNILQTTQVRRQRRGSLYSLGASTIASNDCSPFMVNLSHQSDYLNNSRERDAAWWLQDPKPIRPSRRNSMNSVICSMGTSTLTSYESSFNVEEIGHRRTRRHSISSRADSTVTYGELSHSMPRLVAYCEPDISILSNIAGGAHNSNHHHHHHVPNRRQPRRNSMFSVGASTITSHDCSTAMKDISFWYDHQQSLPAGFHALQDAGPRRPARRQSMSSFGVSAIAENRYENESGEIFTAMPQLADYSFAVPSQLHNFQDAKRRRRPRRGSLFSLGASTIATVESDDCHNVVPEETASQLCLSMKSDDQSEEIPALAEFICDGDTLPPAPAPHFLEFRSRNSTIESLEGDNDWDFTESSYNHDDFADFQEVPTLRVSFSKIAEVSDMDSSSTTADSTYSFSTPAPITEA